MGAGSGALPGQNAPEGSEDAGMPEWDDDDLVAMQAEPMVALATLALLPTRPACM